MLTMTGDAEKFISGGDSLLVKQDIRDYIEQHILPKYSLFDKAHNVEHVDMVISNSMSIAKDYRVDINMVYVIAAYHDIGLIQGRYNHEKNSAAFLLSDSKLKDWFSEDELRLMSEAVEDHRASCSHEPRNIYGKIVSEADRDVDYMTVLTRTIQYSLANSPDYTYEQHFTRSYKHVRDKFGENGYLKLWLDTEVNRKNLQLLRTAISSKETFIADFEKVFLNCSKQVE